MALPMTKAEAKAANEANLNIETPGVVLVGRLRSVGDNLDAAEQSAANAVNSVRRPLFRGRTARHTRKIVARPRKMKKPPLSVHAVINTDEPSAGSRPSLSRVMGIR